MRRSLVYLAILSIVPLTVGVQCQIASTHHPVIAASQPSVVVPIHCQVPAHSARLFAGSIGLAVGIGNRNLEACLLVRVAQAPAQQ